MRPPSSTGSCETSAARMRTKAVSSVSSGLHDDRFAFGEAAGDEVAQVAVALAGPQPPARHPAVVVDLGEILGAGVADEGDDALRLGLLAAVAQRRGEQRAGRGAGQDAFLAQQVARGGKASASGIA